MTPRPLLLTLFLLASPVTMMAAEVTHLGSLTAGRRNVSAIFLPDGRLVVAGGPGNSVEIAELHAGGVSSEAIATTRLPLVGHTATAVPDGRVILIGGGYQTDGRHTFGIYGTRDVDAVDAHGLTALPPLQDARTRHAATLLDDGRILVTGGHTTNIGGFHLWETFLMSAEIVDPVAGTTTRIAPMASARSGHTATRLADGRVLIAGGHVESLQAISSVEIFDPALGTFTPLPDMRARRYGHTATLLNDGRVLVVGGADEPFQVAEFFDPSTDSFAAASGADVGYRRHHTATLLDDGSVLLAGGAEDAVVYDPMADVVVDQVMLGAVLQEHAAVALRGGAALLVGGYRDSFNVSDDVLRYSRAGHTRRRAVR